MPLYQSICRTWFMKSGLPNASLSPKISPSQFPTFVAITGLWAAKLSSTAKGCPSLMLVNIVISILPRYSLISTLPVNTSHQLIRACQGTAGGTGMPRWKDNGYAEWGFHRKNGGYRGETGWGWREDSCGHSPLPWIYFAILPMTPAYPVHTQWYKSALGSSA